MGDRDTRKTGVEAVWKAEALTVSCLRICCRMIPDDDYIWYLAQSPERKREIFSGTIFVTLKAPNLAPSKNGCVRKRPKPTTRSQILRERERERAGEYEETFGQHPIYDLPIPHRLWSWDREISPFLLWEAVKNRSLGDDKERFCFEYQKDETSREADKRTAASKLAEHHREATVGLGHCCRLERLVVLGPVTEWSQLQQLVGACRFRVGTMAG